MSEHREISQYRSQIETPLGSVDLVFLGNNGESPLSDKEVRTLILGSNAVVLDGDDDFVKNPDLVANRLENSRRYANVIAAAKDNQTPVIVADMDFPGLDIGKLENWAIMAAEALVAVGIVRAATLIKKDLPPGGKMTRRSLLGILGGVAAAWATAPLASSIFKEFADTTDLGEGISRTAEDYSRAMHPEYQKTIDDARDLFLAYKIIRKMETSPNDNTNIAAFIGQERAGVDDILRRYAAGSVSREDIELTCNKLQTRLPSSFSYVGNVSYANGQIGIIPERVL